MLSYNLLTKCKNAYRQPQISFGLVQVYRFIEVENSQKDVR